MLVLWLLKLILQARTKTHSASVQTAVVVIIAATCSPRACVCYVRLRRHSQRHGFALPPAPNARCPIHNSVMDAALHSPPSAAPRSTMGVLGKRVLGVGVGPDRPSTEIIILGGREEIKGVLEVSDSESYSERGSRRGSRQGRLFCGAFLPSLSLNGSRFPSAAGASLGRIHQTRPATTTTTTA